MSGLNLLTVQDSISAYIKAQFTAYEVHDDIILDNDFVIKQGNKVKPYIVLQYGGLRSSSTGSSFAGARNDEYYSTVDIAVVAPTPRQCKRALNIIIDRVVGWPPTDSSPMSIDGGMDILGVGNNNGKPTVYLASSRLRYAVNAQNVGAYITP
jgi:hypothetical protein